MEESQEVAPDHPNPHIRDVAAQDISSSIAVAGHPIHAMLVHFPIAFVIATLGVDIFYWWNGDRFWLEVGKWSAGAAFIFGVLAAVVGTLELLAVPGIRARVASWNHAIAAMVLLAIAGCNAGLRLYWPDMVLPSGLMLSVLASLATAFAGWHGGKLVFDHGVGLLISPRQ
ncbi:membrane protein [Devosia epidermidihirudinis]|uniref:Membrane protein n=1 Tax=Devosia epidermidihirudinis TaxID=1293439 RepID=A0A0F5Q2R9_9HYPH|nr:membrane protein [Devosia epidermidihirudinis]